ncbi:MAG TPA: DUF362 domain-containing protein [Desulfobacteraceae bacterium]|nr:DUF362 domain-containing protein [Desulfobacteraceae bacterium]
MKYIDRREFMKISSRWAALASAGAVVPGIFTQAMAEPAPEIVVAKGNPPGAAARAAVEGLGGMARFVARGARVVIKPNMSFAKGPEEAANTHPDVVRELAVMCREAGASSVLVLDNPLQNVEMCLERSRLKEACENIPGTGVEASSRRRDFREVSVPLGKSLKSTMIMKKVLEADVLIAAPVAKSHSGTGVSLSMKGMMGLIYNRREFHTSMDLNEAIVDLCTVLKPDLTVVDASRILSDGGPGGPGKVIRLDTVIASTDMVAADAMAVELGTWYGRRFKGAQVAHIRMAHERGLGNMEFAGRSIKEVAV